MKSLAKKFNEKLSPNYSSLRLVFHVSQLWKEMGSIEKLQPIPRTLAGEMEWKVSSPMKRSILGTRIPAIMHHFPDLHQEDKVNLKGEGI